MNRKFTSDDDFVRALYIHLLKREPADGEHAAWVAGIEGGMSDRDVFASFIACDEYRAYQGLNLTYQPGHFHSPIVDPRQLVGSRRPRRDIDPEQIPGIDLSLSRMVAWWRRNCDVIQASSFSDVADGRRRYHSQNGAFPAGDAAVLRAMIIEHQPSHMIEVGSGFSSACMLDVIDEAGLDTSLTFIEPHAARLRAVLRPDDTERARIIESPLQEINLEEFRGLGRNDILFVDSTHVMKTGSDVNAIFFQVLPSLTAGVLIHFHDIGYPFEYPDEWIYEQNFSWNEAYGLRAFLMHNNDYRVEFMTALFARMAGAVIEETYPQFREYAGGSLWLRKEGPATYFETES